MPQRPQPCHKTLQHWTHHYYLVKLTKYTPPTEITSTYFDSTNAEGSPERLAGCHALRWIAKRLPESSKLQTQVNNWLVATLPVCWTLPHHHWMLGTAQCRKLNQCWFGYWGNCAKCIKHTANLHLIVEGSVTIGHGPVTYDNRKEMLLASLDFNFHQGTLSTDSPHLHILVCLIILLL